MGFQETPADLLDQVPGDFSNRKPPLSIVEFVEGRE